MSVAVAVAALPAAFPGDQFALPATEQDVTLNSSYLLQLEISNLHASSKKARKKYRTLSRSSYLDALANVLGKTRATMIGFGVR